MNFESKAHEFTGSVDETYAVIQQLASSSSGKTCEVDFVAQNGAERLYVQVAYLLATDATIEREFSVLERISDNYPKYVLSMDNINRRRNGILHQNVVKFLLEPDADSHNR